MVSRASNTLAVWIGLNVGGAVFIGVWAYCVMSNDWLLGFFFGWIPASIMGVIAGVVVFGLTQGVAGLLAPQVSASKTPPSDPSAGISTH